MTTYLDFLKDLFEFKNEYCERGSDNIIDAPWYTIRDAEQLNKEENI